MEHLFQEEFRRSYDQGYAFGLNPSFAKWEDLNSLAPNQRNEAFVRGFKIGREEYEKLNGSVHEQMPEIILTERMLLGFRIDAQLGIPLQVAKFNDRQKQFIKLHYESGAKLYNLSQHLNLYSILIENDISTLPIEAL